MKPYELVQKGTQVVQSCSNANQLFVASNFCDRIVENIKNPAAKNNVKKFLDAVIDDKQKQIRKDRPEEFVINWKF